MTRLTLPFVILTASAVCQETQFGLSKTPGVQQQESFSNRSEGVAYRLRLPAAREGWQILAQNPYSQQARLQVNRHGRRGVIVREGLRQHAVAPGESAVIEMKDIAADTVLDLKAPRHLRLGLRRAGEEVSFALPALDGVAEYDIFSPEREQEIDLSGSQVGTLHAGPRGGKATRAAAGSGVLSVAYRTPGKVETPAENSLEASLALQHVGGTRWHATLTFTARSDVQNGYAKILLPEDATPVDPLTPWRGQLRTGSAARLEADFEMPDGGFTISGAFYSLLDDGSLQASRRAWAAARSGPAGYQVEYRAPETPLPPAVPLDSTQPLAPRALDVTTARARSRRMTPQPGAGAITYNRQISANLPASVGQTVSSFRFYGRAGDFVRVTLSAPSFDGALRLYGPGGALLAANDDTETLDSRIPESGLLELADDGVYTVEVAGAPEPGRGEFRLAVWSPDRREPLDRRLAPYLTARGGQTLLEWDAAAEVGVELSVERSCGAESFRRAGAVSRAAGRFALAAAKPSQPCSYRLVAEGEGWREETTPLVDSGDRRSADTATAQGRFTYNFESQQLGIRRARVVLVRNEGGNLTALAAGPTDDEGRFSIPFDPTLISPSGRMFARLFASDHQQVIAGVFNTETAQGLAYAVDTEPIAVSQSATVVNLGTLPVERIGANPPFYIYDSIVEGYLLSERLLAFRPPVRIEVLYPLRNQNGVIEDNGAFYFQNTIHVGRKYVAVRDVLLHEYGHFLADKSGFNQTQGGQHFFPFRARVNASLAWGESWATFFSIAAQVESGRAETFYDSFTSDGGFRYDLEDGHNAEVIAASAQGDDNEGSVQFVLWDLYDGNQDLLPNVAGQRDTVRMSIRDVYNVAAAFATTSSDQRANVNLMVRFYGSLWQNVPAAHTQRQAIVNLFADQRMNFGSPPAAPTNLRSTASAPPALAWDGTTGTGGSFEVQRRSAAVFEVAGRTAQNSFTDSTAPAAALSYRVFARNVLSGREPILLFSAESPTITVQPGGAPPDRLRIGVGQTASGALSAASPRRSVRCDQCAAELYELTVAAEQTLAITMSSAAFDSFLVLQDGAGNTLASDDDSAGNRNARITRTLAPGAYLVEASASRAGGVGAYSLSVAVQGTAPPPARATIAPGQSVNGVLSPTSSRSSGCSACFADLYDFTIPASQQLTLTMASAAFDAFLIVLDAKGNKIATDDDSAGGTNARISRTFAAGAYTVEATTFSSNAQGGYTLALATGGTGPGPATRPIDIGQTVAGSLSEASGRSQGCNGCYADLYQFTLTSPRTLSITMNSGVLDAFLRLTAADGAVVGTDNDSGGGTNAQITRSLAPGVYRLEATTFRAGIGGDYTLALQPVASGVTPVNVGQTVNGTLSAQSSRSATCPTCFADVYEFTINSPRILSVTLASLVFDSYLVVLDSRGAVVAEDDDSGGSRNALVTRRFAAGTYRIEATTYLPGASGAYQIGLLAPDIRLTRIEVGQRISGSLAATSARATGCLSCFADLYQFTVTSSRVLSITMSSTTFDAFLVVLDASGAVIAGDDDSAGGTNARVTRTFAPGTYTIEASSALPVATGPYSLAVEESTFPVRALAFNTPFNGNLSPASSRSAGCSTCYADLYEFTVTASQTLVINMTSTVIDSYLQLLDAAGSVIATDDDSAGGRNARIVRTLNPGIYRVEATTYGRQQSGPYTLTLRALGSAATAVSLGQALNGNLHPATSGRSLDCSECITDAYLLTLNTTQAVSIEMQSTAFSTRLRMHDAATFSTVVTSQANETGLSARIARLLPPGTYRIEATTAIVSAGGSYTLTVRQGTVTDIAIGQMINSNLNSAALRSVDGPSFFTDLYRLTVAGQPETLIIGLASFAFDTWLNVLDAGARRIVFNDDFVPGETTNSGIIRTFNPGVYYIEASSFGGRESGPYQIIVQRAP